LLSLFLPVRIKHNPGAAKRIPTIRDASHRGRTMASAAIAEQVRMRRDGEGYGVKGGLWGQIFIIDKVQLQSQICQL
jgi:hypothetical protein